MTFQHNTPNVNAGQDPVIFDGGRLPGALIAAARIRNAERALGELTDMEFAAVVVEAMRKRPAVLAERVIDRVTK